VGEAIPGWQGGNAELPCLVIITENEVGLGEGRCQKVTRTGEISKTTVEEEDM